MSGRTQNVSRRDRGIRAILTPIAIVGVLWLYYSVPHDLPALVAMGGLGMLAFILGVSAITGTCGIYTTLGIDTCRCEDEYSGGNTWG